MIVYAIVGEVLVVRDSKGCYAVIRGEDFETAKRDPRGTAISLASRGRSVIAECEALLAMADERHEVDF
jgi:hypothetical protein